MQGTKKLVLDVRKIKKIHRCTKSVTITQKIDDREAVAAGCQVGKKMVFLFH